ncbi:glutamate--tRNA ligase [Spirochaeta lutea]|uniref:Glutamate--tRNA ligase n=1 Tax=Spirochaeta lutea TaxID=1480694 RepID=A0A098R0F1_9SPIO|nr:glutamate--tRNA ligase [Spirochaeta lutea]KGE73645.1 glutamyl-tRNA synthetase [Spirochaeta lutea]
MSVRVRYAPSPTGLQHIGGLRTALFNYFFARSQGGRFILRVEDTDQERFTPEALEDIYRTFDWLGIQEDEGPRNGGSYGPYIQSERKGLYQQYAQQLIDTGCAYHCFCTSERLEQLRHEQTQTKQGAQGYDRHCRSLSPQMVQERLERGETSVIRFKIPLEGDTIVEDLVLGPVRRKNEDISPDPVLLKSDGFPTYHLANVVDDHLMGISHILRAQEWIPSGPLHVLLYNAFGWEPPVYVHLPMVMGKDGQKLSKRHGSTAVAEFRRLGYLPEALMNYISLLGWSLDDSREFFSRQDLEALFDITRINKSPAVFDYKKLEWFNGQYIRELDGESLERMVIPYLQEACLVEDPISEGEKTILHGAIPLAQERLRLLSDAPDVLGFLFRDELSFDPLMLVPKGLDAAQTKEVLEAVQPKLESIFSGEGTEEGEDLLHRLAEDLGKKVGQVMMPIRIAVTGTKASPPLIPSLHLLGQKKTEERIARAIILLEQIA